MDVKHCIEIVLVQFIPSPVPISNCLSDTQYKGYLKPVNLLICLIGILFSVQQMGKLSNTHEVMFTLHQGFINGGALYCIL